MYEPDQGNCTPFAAYRSVIFYLHAALFSCYIHNSGMVVTRNDA
nr:MAG TPA: hypothetical protein [Caudoviricetes sp.]